MVNKDFHILVDLNYWDKVLPPLTFISLSYPLPLLPSPLPDLLDWYLIVIIALFTLVNKAIMTIKYQLLNGKVIQKTLTSHKFFNKFIFIYVM